MARPQYVALSRVRAMILELIRMHVPSVAGLRLDAFRGPYRAGNWRVEWLNVPVEDYGATRDIADAMEAKRFTGSWCWTGTCSMGRYSGGSRRALDQLGGSDLALANAPQRL